MRGRRRQLYPQVGEKQSASSSHPQAVDAGSSSFIHHELNPGQAKAVSPLTVGPVGVLNRLKETSVGHFTGRMIPGCWCFHISWKVSGRRGGSGSAAEVRIWLASGVGWVPRSTWWTFLPEESPVMSLVPLVAAREMSLGNELGKLDTS